MNLEGREYNPELIYNILLACKAMGITTEKGDWTLERVEELKKDGILNALEIAIFEADEMWQGFDLSKKMPEV